MSELIIDTIDREEEAFDLLKEAGVVVEDAGARCVNVATVPDSSITKVEEILAAYLIEFQWGGEEDDGEEYEDDYSEEDEEDA